MTAGETLALGPLDIASGRPIGLDPAAPALPSPARAGPPVRHLERAVLAALARPPCVVSFSGGRDSSAVLALATRVARHEGMPLPVPVTLRFSRAPEADENDWQERVVAHLGLPDWIRLEFDDELDLVGPVASEVLLRHGLVWPPNSHFHVPVLDQARGGSVLTGIDGDGLLASWRWARPAAVLGRRVPPRRRDLLRVGLALSPQPVRRLQTRWSASPDISWLQPQARRTLVRRWTAVSAAEPVRWDARVRWWAQLRSVRMVQQTFALMAAHAGVLAVHPLADPSFLAAIAGAGGRWGLGDRTAVMRSLFGDILPEEVLQRRTKARLDGPFWNRHSRSFVAGWHGEGVDRSIVDTDSLRAIWSTAVPNALTSTLLQSAWLRSAAGPGRSAGGQAPQAVPDER